LDKMTGKARSRLRAVLAAAMAGGLVGAGAWATGAEAGHGATDTLGHTTVEQTLVGTDHPDEDINFQYLSATGTGEPYIMREGPGGDGEDKLGVAQAGRETRRESLFYLGQLSDFQLADEESPARVEFLDFGPFSSAFRQNEAFLAHLADSMVRQVNAFAPASPLTAGDGSRRSMDLTLNTGDIADSQQKNETLWVRAIAEGGPLAPGSGTNPVTSGDPICAAAGVLGLVPDAANPQNYTGVQDYDDYVEGLAQFYDPDQPLGPFADWPAYPGVMNRVQAEFEAAGLDVPHYASFGNHDALVQGNASANAAYERVATGCVKPMAPLTADTDTLQEALEGIAALNLPAVLNLLTSDPTKIALVPPDQARQFVSKQQWKQIWKDGTQPDGHGFDYVDPAEEAASGGSAGYYSWEPEPGIRFISIDTVSEAGIIGPSADGNVDDPQFQWLRAELEEATAADELIVLFSHHAPKSLTADVADELAGPCAGDDGHGHGTNPGCDPDPRDSEPLHLEADMVSFVHEYPNVIAWVAGHSHQNTVDAYPDPDGPGGFWAIRTAAEADWPMQSRLIEIFDNQDGTLSIFGTVLDLAAPAASVGPETDSSALNAEQLASLGRTIGFNETQYGAANCGNCAGQASDRNVELLVDDPREGGGPGPGPGPGPDSGRCEARIEGTEGKDRLRGTAASERILGRGGRDRLSGGGGRDCVKGGPGKDRVKGGGDKDRLAGGRGKDRLRGGGAKDRVSGSRGADKLVGGAGKDKLRGGNRGDRINAMDGERDRVNCGRGNDFVRSDFEDVLRNCERGVSGGP
jgi:metallophosphoesterase (TIGR03767 family)